MSDNLIASLTVGGLTSEQEAQLNKIPIIEQRVGATTNDLNTKANT